MTLPTQSRPDEYLPPKPSSLRCRLGFHRPTRIPQDTIAMFAELGVYKPGSWAADTCPWPGGWIGPCVYAWCLRCGAELEPEKIAAAMALLDKVRAEAGDEDAS